MVCSFFASVTKSEISLSPSCPGYIGRKTLKKYKGRNFLYSYIILLRINPRTTMHYYDYGIIILTLLDTWWEPPPSQTEGRGVNRWLAPALSMPECVLFVSSGPLSGLLTQSTYHIVQFKRRLVGWLTGCLTSQQHAGVSQGRICSDNLMC